MISNIDGHRLDGWRQGNNVRLGCGFRGNALSPSAYRSAMLNFLLAHVDVLVIGHCFLVGREND